MMSLSRGQYIKLERGERQLTARTIVSAAKAFGVLESEVLAEATTAPIVGKVGAGPDGSVIFAEGDEGIGTAPMPPGGNERTVAVEVSGTSMRGVAEDGWLIYYDDRRSPIESDMIGELCVVALADGRVVVKTPYHGRNKDSYDLESTNAATMRDERVEWAALVTAIVPRATARRIARSAPARSGSAAD